MLKAYENILLIILKFLRTDFGDILTYLYDILTYFIDSENIQFSNMIFLVIFPKINSKSISGLFLPASFDFDLIMTMEPLKGIPPKQVFPPKSTFPPSGRVKFAHLPKQVKMQNMTPPADWGEGTVVLNIILAAFKSFLSQSRCSLKPKKFLKTPTEGVRAPPDPLLTLATLAFLLIIFTCGIMPVFYPILVPAMFFDIHPGHNKTA